uniref:Serine/arginine-rich splicing factor 2 n=1 Tax=Steinernema glaseri TaxID=37863 RepID=A0A1I7ZDV5_9BILA
MARRSGPPAIDGLYSLKVDNISYHTTSHDLRRMFDRYGEIGDIHIPRDRHTRTSRGFAFVRFYNRKDAEYAMNKNDGRLVDGREIRVSMARYERPIDERGSRRGGDRYDDRRDRGDRSDDRRDRDRRDRHRRWSSLFFPLSHVG